MKTPPPDANGWKAIESAPKEVWAKSQMVICAHDTKRWIRFGRYYGELKRWYYSGTNERSQWAETPGDAPTHFQHMLALPIPPLSKDDR